MAGGLRLIQEKELKPTKADVDKWLVDLGAYHHFDNTVCGIVKKMRNRILERAAIDERTAAKRTAAVQKVKSF